MNRKTTTPALLALAGVAIMALAAPQVAGAASSAYPNPSNARSFGTTDGGWHSSTSFAGLCSRASTARR